MYHRVDQGNVHEIMKHGREILLNIVEIKERNILVIFLIKQSPPCKCGCYQKIGLDNVKDIFNNFWEISDYNQQNYYISKLVHTSEIKCSVVKGRLSRTQRRIHYTVIHANTVINVCRTAFFNIFYLFFGSVKPIICL